MHAHRLRAWPRFRTSAALAIAHSAESADLALLGSMFLGIGRSLHASLLSLGTFVMYRGLVQARAARTQSMTQACVPQRGAPAREAAHAVLLRARCCCASVARRCCPGACRWPA
jgi:hypothetical protein